MSNHPRINGKATQAPSPSLRRPTLAVLISSVVVMIHCGMGLVSGLIIVALGLNEWATRPTGQPPWIEWLYMGLVFVVLAAVVGYCQYRAVRRRSPVLSYIVGVLYLILGLAQCVLIPLSPQAGVSGYILTAATLFVGVSMVRWGWQLARGKR
jgi:drug/metabolite transporter (DMT)-like permease